MVYVGSLGKISILSMLLWVRKVKFMVMVFNVINERLNFEMVKFFLR